MTLKWIMTNFGEPSVGIEIMIAGDALEYSIITPLTAKACYKDKEYNCDFIETEDTSGSKLLYIAIDDIQIPQSKKPSIDIKK